MNEQNTSLKYLHYIKVYKAWLNFSTLQGLIRSNNKSPPSFYKVVYIKLIGNKIIMLQITGANVYSITSFYNSH